ncbi:MAG: VCBS repeat-containing protein [Planctomycetes bacterium]|nr:VCBS repeat-containing protein [Planctomycetota bacterium]
MRPREPHRSCPNSVLALLSLCGAFTSSGLGQNLFAAKNLPTELQPSAVALTDLNGDGRQDVLAANAGSSSLTVLLGQGAWVFGPNKQYATIPSATDLLTGDVDADGKLDAIFARLNGSAVSMLRGTGTGAFLPGLSAYSAAAGAEVLRGADLDGDGRFDLVTANRVAGSISVLLGSPAGGFAPAINTSVGSSPTGLALGDFDLDGQLDAVTANEGSANLSLLTQVALGGSAPAGMPATYALAQAPRSLVSLDVNADGRQDVAFTFPSAGSVGWMLGSASGFGSVVTLGAGASVSGLSTADITGDGRADLIAVNSVPWGQLQVLRNNGASGFLGAKSYLAGNSPTEVALGELSGDGALDLVIGNNSSLGSYATALRGDGAGGFVVPKTTPIGDGPWHLETADLNADGRSDAVVTNASSNTISILLASSAAVAFSMPLSATTGQAPRCVVLRDFNGDGKLDAAVANSSPPPYTSGTIGIHLGSGFGSLPQVSQVQANGGPWYLAAGDFNNNGATDLVFANRYTSRVGLTLGNGAGAFGAPSLIQTFSNGQPYQLAVGDFNEDGNLDVLTCDSNTGILTRLHGNGSGSFAPAAGVPVGGTPSAITLADLNLDGHTDAVVCRLEPEDDVVTLLGSGLGTFPQNQKYVTGTGPRSARVGDLDRDGVLDIIVANRTASNVAFLRGSTTPPFKLEATYLCGLAPRDLALVDLDADGGLDVATANTDGSVSLLLHELGVPAGLSPFGTGTPGCRGRIGLSASGSPTVGNATFGLECTNVPPTGLGAILIGDVASTGSGFDPLGVGIQMHVDALASTVLFGYDSQSGGSASSFGRVAIPGIPALVGASFACQGYFEEPPLETCSKSPYRVVASRGLIITIQP